MVEAAQVHDAVGVPEDATFHAADRLAAHAAHQLGRGGAAGKRDPVAELDQVRRQIADRRLRAAQRPHEWRIRVVSQCGGVDEDDVHVAAL
jgi:hypothetical protein